jgi:hypothetical protein
MLGSRQTSVTKPTRMSLAQFSENLTSGNSQGRPDCASSTTEGVALESPGQKRFANDVVAAMSNPALQANDGAAEVPELLITRQTSEGG